MKFLISVAFMISLLAVAARNDRAEAGKHPVELAASPLCSECHTDWRASMDHDRGFAERHRFLAAQRGETCHACHEVSFCADCHANKEELKPGDKYKGEPARFFPHRGDYMTRHRIDGRINPAACYRCHGRSNNARCRACHR